MRIQCTLYEMENPQHYNGSWAGLARCTKGGKETWVNSFVYGIQLHP